MEITKFTKEDLYKNNSAEYLANPRIVQPDEKSVFGGMQIDMTTGETLSEFTLKAGDIVPEQLSKA